MTKSENLGKSNHRRSGNVLALVGLLILTASTVLLSFSVRALFIKYYSAGDISETENRLELSNFYPVGGLALLWIIGTAIVYVVLLRYRNRQRWFFYSSILAGIFTSVVFFPTGIIGGMIVVFPFLLKRDQFNSF